MGRDLDVGAGPPDNRVRRSGEPCCETCFAKAHSTEIGFTRPCVPVEGLRCAERKGISDAEARFQMFLGIAGSLLAFLFLMRNQDDSTVIFVDLHYRNTTYS